MTEQITVPKQTLEAIRGAMEQHGINEAIETCRYPDCKCPTESPCLKGLQPGNLKDLTP